MIIPRHTAGNLSSLTKLIAEEGITFFDFGCSNGDGTLHMQSITGRKGLGFDVDPAKLKVAAERGILCTSVDIFTLPDHPLVPDTIIFHMLEHLESLANAKQMIEKACIVSTRAVLIRQPYFDADTRLFHQGFKTFYSHWTGHPNRMTTSDFYFVLSAYRAQGLIKDFVIAYRGLITNSSDDRIHPLDSPIDSHQYNPKVHPKKTMGVRFNFPVFEEIQVLVDIDGNDFRPIKALCTWEHVACDTHSRTWHNPHARISVKAYGAKLKSDLRSRFRGRIAAEQSQD
jgi:hypothetical protein